MFHVSQEIRRSGDDEIRYNAKKSGYSYHPSPSSDTSSTLKEGKPDTFTAVAGG
jgi:hypothetical protein